MRNFNFSKRSLKYIVIFSLILLFAFAFVVYQGKRSSSSSQSLSGGELPKENMVLLTDSGFSPQQIVIQSGTAVRWRNNLSVDASINSDNYPTNKLYPELNLGKFKPGQTLVHVFTKAGTYTYHNQMQNNEIGTVVVQ